MSGHIGPFRNKSVMSEVNSSSIWQKTLFKMLKKKKKIHPKPSIRKWWVIILININYITVLCCVYLFSCWKINFLTKIFVRREWWRMWFFKITFNQSIRETLFELSWMGLTQQNTSSSDQVCLLRYNFYLEFSGGSISSIQFCWR